MAEGGDRGVTGPVLSPGDVLIHNYRIDAFLARGGMGEVYRAHHLGLGTQNAIKIINSAYADDPRIVALFQREAAVLRSVRDDAIVGYDGAFLDERGRLFLSMEFVDGQSLKARLKERALRVDEVRRLRQRLARGLAAAHDKGVIHRDLSPDNVLLPGGAIDQAKIIDFGIAKQLHAGATTLIGDGFAGKLGYVAPEQMDAQYGDVGPATDVYSLGLILAAAASGKPLDMGATYPRAVAARRQVPDLGTVPGPLHAELATMLQPYAGDRPQSMRALIDGDPLPAPVSGTGPPADEAATVVVPTKAQARATGQGPVGLDGGNADPAGDERTRPHRRPLALMAGVAGVALAAAAAAFVYLGGMPDQAPDPGPDQSPANNSPAVAPTTPSEPLSPAPLLPAPTIGTVDPALDPLSVFRHTAADGTPCRACPDMIALPAGGFVMGSPDDEEGRRRNEGPQRRVQIPAFALAATEVTFAEWDACVADGGCNGHRPDDQGWGRGDQPVITVSWADAQAYLDWLNTKVDGTPFRLPSEAEWEYAARAGTATQYAFGEDITPDQANFGRALGQTRAVGRYDQNGWGLFDMHGNVSEWVQDCWHDSYEGAPVDGSAWQSHSCTFRVQRGGSWNFHQDLARSAFRNANNPNDRLTGIGFRIASGLPEPTPDR